MKKLIVMNPNDTRYIAAEKRIKEAFYELLSKKSVEEIRTQEIIALAGINKSTFYSHYRDKYDLLAGLGSDAADLLSPALEMIFSTIVSEEQKRTDIEEAYIFLSRTFLDNEQYFRVVMKDPSGSLFAARIADRIEAIWMAEELSDPSDVYNLYLINAITYIIIGTIEKWVRRDCVDPPSDLIRLAEDVGIGVRHALLRSI